MLEMVRFKIIICSIQSSLFCLPEIIWLLIGCSDTNVRRFVKKKDEILWDLFHFVRRAIFLIVYFNFNRSRCKSSITKFDVSLKVISFVGRFVVFSAVGTVLRCIFQFVGIVVRWVNFRECEGVDALMKLLEMLFHVRWYVIHLS